MAKRLLDHVVVVDVEATCWDGPVPEGQVNEIIEVGVCLLEVATGERSERRGILVKPERSTVSAFCTELTTLTQEDVDGGVTFAEACAELKHYQSARRVWASYGDYDRLQFERQCTETGVKYPFSPKHVNVKTLFALKNKLTGEVGMARALELANRELVGTHHRGVDDAWNIAGLLGELLA
jgi:inhibitor of KinA sporulation pathway (predicted exonuclease)